MATGLRLPELRDIEHATQIVPPHWVDDDAILATQRRHRRLSFERFADGTLLVTPPPGWKSGVRNTELVWQVTAWAKAGHPGLVMGPGGGVGFDDGALLAPDATYISKRRWAAADHARTFAYAVPDAVFEVLSQTDRIATTRRKLRTYLSNGVTLAVLIDCWRRHVYVGCWGDADTRDLGWIDRLDCAPAMPGFVLDLAAVCAASDVKDEHSDQRDCCREDTGDHPPQP